jgi:GNAT superfamily N-acetyltransferase
MDIALRKADVGELDKGLSLLKEAAEWLRDRGIDSWQNWHNPPQNHVKWVRKGFERNEFFFAEVAGEIVGCFRLQWDDPMHWGDRVGDAGYIHSFTVVRRLAGQGVGRQILSLVESHCRAAGKESLRLDCNKHVPGLCHYYENAGFKPVGEIAVAGEELVLYEKPLGST